MDKSSVFVGGTIGALIVIVAFAVLFVSPPESIKPEIVVSNGHSVNVVGETIQIYPHNLSLIEIFERSESGVVRVNVQRGEVDDVTGGLGSGFVFD
ncbi:MAG: trypsin, partial [Nitrosopumilus sp.]